jgi:hypothetical protein
VAGTNSLLWKLRNQNGESVASGLYLYFVQAENAGQMEQSSGKVVVLR